MLIQLRAAPASIDTQDVKINLRRQLPTESIAERILNNAAVDLHA
jgi:hypothetical protein